MKNTEGSRFIIGLGADDQEYRINGVRYVAASRFQKPFEKPKNPMMSERISGYLSGDFADLTVPSSSDTMAGEYVVRLSERRIYAVEKIKRKYRNYSIVLPPVS